MWEEVGGGAQWHRLDTDGQTDRQTRCTRSECDSVGV